MPRMGTVENTYGCAVARLACVGWTPSSLAEVKGLSSWNDEYKMGPSDSQDGSKNQSTEQPFFAYITKSFFSRINTCV